MLKPSLFFALVLLIILYIKAIMYGRLARLEKKAVSRNETISKHRRSARQVFWYMVILVIIVESITRVRGGGEYDALFWVHVAVFAIPFFLLLVYLTFITTGLKLPATHRSVAWASVICFSGMVITGVPMVLRLN